MKSSSTRWSKLKKKKNRIERSSNRRSIYNQRKGREMKISENGTFKRSAKPAGVPNEAATATTTYRCQDKRESPKTSIISGSYSHYCTQLLRQESLLTSLDNSV